MRLSCTQKNKELKEGRKKDTKSIKVWLKKKKKITYMELKQFDSNRSDGDKWLTLTNVPLVLPRSIR